MIKETLVYNIPVYDIHNSDMPPMGYYFITQEQRIGMIFYNVNYLDFDKETNEICEIPNSLNMALIIAKALNNPSCVEGL
jgi:hypothetical protein